MKLYKNLILRIIKPMLHQISTMINPEKAMYPGRITPTKSRLAVSSLKNLQQETPNATTPSPIKILKNLSTVVNWASSRSRFLLFLLYFDVDYLFYMFSLFTSNLFSRAAGALFFDVSCEFDLLLLVLPSKASAALLLSPSISNLYLMLNG